MKITISNLEENVGTAQIELTSKEIKKIRKACQNWDTDGER